MRLQLGRGLAAWALPWVLCVGAAAAADTSYPSKPIRIINPYASGGSASNLARMLGQKLQEEFGSPVVVEDRPGGNTIIGTEQVARATPDGYTLLWQASGHVVTPHLFPVSYDVTKDFAPIASFASAELILVVNSSVPVKNLSEFIAYAKANPQAINYASAGTGGPAHLAGEMFKSLSGAPMQHIPYKGVGPAVTDLVGGRVQAAFQTQSVTIQHLATGSLRALAVSGPTRLKGLGDVPTFAELGFPTFETRFWYGLFAPRGTPIPIISKLSAAVKNALGSADVQAQIALAGMNPLLTSPAEFGKIVDGDYRRYGEVVKAAGIKGE